MTGDEIIGRLRENEPELRRLGIERLALFGSMARHDEHLGSDIDLLASFEETRALSLLDVVHLENVLSDLLGCKVDLVEERVLKPRIRDHVERDAIRAF